MARRHSSGDRLERLRAEAAATEREKEEKRKAKPAKPAKPAKRTRAAAKPKTPPRMMVVWAVCDPKGIVVSNFRFPHKAVADAECAELSSSSGKPHKVIRHKVPFE